METVRGSDDRASDARRVGTYAVAALAMQIVFLTVWVIRYYLLHDRSAPMVGSDFAIFWATARVALEHGPTAIFSPQWIQPIEAALRPFDDFAPWPYPPTFLLVVIPFGSMPFASAVALFGVLTIGCYAAVVARLTRSLDGQWRLAVAAFPGLIGAALTMQNAFLTVAAAGAALLLLRSRPVVAGACVAILMVKPQYGVLFPLALICGRHWKALVSAGVFSAAIVATSVAVFGWRAWTAFFAFLPTFNRGMIEYGETLWRGMPSICGLARAAGLSVPIAYAIQAGVAVPAAAACMYVWTRAARFELRAATLAAATLLVQPYYMYYDLLWLVLPLIFLVIDFRNVRPNRLEMAVVALVWIAPAQAFVAMISGTTWPVASAILVAVLAVVVRRSAQSARAS
ncbi:glycosyltransferase family 87 protein [Burkholderia sp. Bp8998]|uniref:glycosyltransferase family 87 protein n=1 Tax=Burkholderia sp. Bp8998 TaxID=2184557 RepID=UPI000F5A7905|nr:glycosyltransferase family 87 protein [Burkholderia sp. Bp8998]RQS23521.1 DUF2029 domain-containing protein [Burkholderia sp. Bp8998]